MPEHHERRGSKTERQDDQTDLQTFFSRKQGDDRSHGRRVVEGQRAIQTAGDILLGWARIQDADGVPGDYYVRQLWDAKGSVNLEKIDPEGFSAVASMCAWTLAHAHAKTGDRHGIAGYLGRSDAFDEAMLRFARAYADQNERDFEVFCASN